MIEYLQKLVVAGFLGAVALVVGTHAQSTDQPVPNFVNALSYDPTHYNCAAGTTLQLRDGFSVYDIDGGTIVGTCTIKMPVTNPVDSQFIRLSIGGSTTITLLQVQDSGGNLLSGGSLSGILASVTPSWQMQVGVYRKIGT